MWDRWPAEKSGFRGKLRDERLNGEIFYSLKGSIIVIEQWRKHYNTGRPPLILELPTDRPQTSAPEKWHLDQRARMQ